MRFRSPLGGVVVAWRPDGAVEAAETAVRTSGRPRSTDHHLLQVSACDLDAEQWMSLLPRGVRHSARLLIWIWEEAAF
jgi:hypothetical protein